MGDHLDRHCTLAPDQASGEFSIVLLSRNIESQTIWQPAQVLPVLRHPSLPRSIFASVEGYECSVPRIFRVLPRATAAAVIAHAEGEIPKERRDSKACQVCQNPVVY